MGQHSHHKSKEPSTVLQLSCCSPTDREPAKAPEDLAASAREALTESVD